ncbi:hypothetical protein CYMTET_41380 [Cymbomonas tetramitiformis]|uniref:Uncharacterized protein n=1 Tax=Cymbomonas tetramitiformis TaxID=36881 RepID=A0AAE0C6A0_9CHLO|nr:hypothetical protein CYMTET_41380 [Cymbomonas tetramitiformis]
MTDLVQTVSGGQPSIEQTPRRSSRVPGGNPHEQPSFREFIDKIVSNSSEDFEASGKLLRLKRYITPNASCQKIDAILEALAQNTRVEALYIQNFDRGFFDEQMDKLIEVLKLKRIWALNIGEISEVSLDAWYRLLDALPHSAVTHMYATEQFLRGTDLKKLMRDAISLSPGDEMQSSRSVQGGEGGMRRTLRDELRPYVYLKWGEGGSDPPLSSRVAIWLCECGTAGEGGEKAGVGQAGSGDGGDAAEAGAVAPAGNCHLAAERAPEEVRECLAGAWLVALLKDDLGVSACTIVCGEVLVKLVVKAARDRHQEWVCVKADAKSSVHVVHCEAMFEAVERGFLELWVWTDLCFGVESLQAVMQKVSEAVGVEEARGVDTQLPPQGPKADDTKKWSDYSSHKRVPNGSMLLPSTPQTGFGWLAVRGRRVFPGSTQHPLTALGRRSSRTQRHFRERRYMEEDVAEEEEVDQEGDEEEDMGLGLGSSVGWKERAKPMDVVGSLASQSRFLEG